MIRSQERFLYVSVFGNERKEKRVLETQGLNGRDAGI